MSENEIDVEGSRRVAAQATPGPWRTGRTTGHVRHYVEPASCAESLSGLVEWMGQSDAEFIATARNNWGALLDEVEALRGQVERASELATLMAQEADSFDQSAMWEAAESSRLDSYRLRAALDPHQEPQDGAQGAAGVEVGSVDGGDAQGRENGREGL